MSAEFDSFSPKKRKEKKNELGNSNKRCKADVALDTLYRQKKNKLSDHTYSIYKTSVFLAAVYPFPIAIVKRSQIYFVLDFGSILRGKKKNYKYFNEISGSCACECGQEFKKGGGETSIACIYAYLIFTLLRSIANEGYAKCSEIVSEVFPIYLYLSL